MCFHFAMKEIRGWYCCMIGLIYMARAGYNPEAGIGFWERFAEYSRQHGGGEGLWFLRTHPLDEVRIKQLKEWLPEVQREYRPR